MQTGDSKEPSRRFESFGDSPRNWLRITTVRVIVQVATFALFSSFLALTTFSNLDRMPALRHWLGKALELDPLIAISTAVTTHSIYRGLIWSLVILIPTLFLGRFFCNWICPLGSLHQFFRWLVQPFRPAEDTAANRYRPSQRVKYYILACLIGAAVLGSLQVGLLDPIALLHRSATDAVTPLASHAGVTTGGEPRFYRGAWLVGFIFVGLLAANLARPRLFCRILCPLGALFGVFSRFAWWRIERDPDTCNGCNRCLLHCEGACDPHAALRSAECLVCFNCIEECPENALSFQRFPPREHEVAAPDLARREVLLAAAGGVLLYGLMRVSGKTPRDVASRAIRPPGALEEGEFLERCIKCAQCIRVCPTNVMQPAGLETGLEGLWTPLLNFRVGHCQLHCTACGHVCPTGAITSMTVERKLGLGSFADRGPIRLGTANIDVGRCLPHSKNVPCVVCQEVCPTSPKAIFTVRERKALQGGTKTAASATETTIRFAEAPDHAAARVVDDPLVTKGWHHDNTKSFVVCVPHPDGTTEVQRIVDGDDSSVTIDGRFVAVPQPGSRVRIEVELAVPRIDPSRCIGCGICERQCPVVGDGRAVYVTADQETRSEHVLSTA